MSSPRVNVLILGGLIHLARPLARFLLSATSPLPVNFVRIADKHYVSAEGSTVYLDPYFLDLLAHDGRLSVVQRNLEVDEVVEELFELPKEQGTGTYDYVFDLTGEGTISDASPTVLMMRTSKLAGRLARIAARNRVRAYVRTTLPFHTVLPNDPTPTEADYYTVRSPKTPRAYYWAQAERAAAFNGAHLNLVILRCGGLYGHSVYTNPFMARLALGQLYHFTRETLTVLWSPSLSLASLHAQDWCTAAWSAARWIDERGKEAADREAGEDLAPLVLRSLDFGPLPFEDDSAMEQWVPPTPVPPSVAARSTNGAVAVSSLMCPTETTVRAPVFHLCDDGDTDQGRVSEVIRQVFPGLETNFSGLSETLWARRNLLSLIDEVNEDHMEAAERMNAASAAWVNVNSPISVMADLDLLSERAIKLDNAKAKRILRWAPQYTLTPEVAREIINDFRQSGAWYVPRQN
ncbi:unnamed protein product [Parajaminaea phylloscopi]